MAGKKHGPGSKRKKKTFNLHTLTKKQKTHLKQFGEIHPGEEKTTREERYKHIKDVPDEKIPESSSSDDSSDEEEVSPYQQLISSITTNQDGSDDEQSEEDEEIAADGNASDEISEGSESSSGDTLGDGSPAENSDIDDKQDPEVDKSLEEEKIDSDDYRDADYQSEEEIQDKSGDEETVANDPFSQHFEQDIEEKFADSLGDKQLWKREEIKLPVLGRCHYMWHKQRKKNIPASRNKDLKSMHVKHKLCEHVGATNRKYSQAAASSTDDLTTYQSWIFSILNRYQDLYLPHRTHKNGEEIRFLYCLHALNHVLKTRSRVVSHNAKIKSKKDDIPDDYRDQGLARPKVLIVLPFRESALKVVNIMADLLVPDNQSFVTNKKRFQSEYGSEIKLPKGKKPEDFDEMFEGNIDDHFRIGLSVAKKSLKLYTDFYSSDIIMASPLGLRTVIGAEGEESRDFDFLTSIEVLIMDQADVFLMQNWDHIQHLFSHMHLQPKESHGVDFSRVRMWTLSGWSKYYRQTLIFSGVPSPEINAVFNKYSQNYSGKILVSKNHSSGSISQIVTQLPQVFHRIETESYSQLADSRFDFFKSKILPEHKDQAMVQTLIFVPSYFDFVRLRNFFKKEEVNFVQISEYSSDRHVNRMRTFFFHGEAHFLLYTERFHFYRRYRLRGIKHLIFYDLPLYAHFYSEMCNMIQDPKNKEIAANFTCTVLYSKYDAQKLAAVVGTDRAGHMINSEKQVHMFVTGDS